MGWVSVFLEITETSSAKHSIVVCLYIKKQHKLYVHVFISVVYTITHPETTENNTVSQTELLKKLSPHREAVRSLINITGMFSLYEG